MHSGRAQSTDRLSSPKHRQRTCLLHVPPCQAGRHHASHRMPPCCPSPPIVRTVVADPAPSMPPVPLLVHRKGASSCPRGGRA